MSCIRWLKLPSSCLPCLSAIKLCMPRRRCAISSPEPLQARRPSEISAFGRLHLCVEPQHGYADSLGQCEDFRLGSLSRR